jgi:hypothetical protein
MASNGDSSNFVLTANYQLEELLVLHPVHNAQCLSPTVCSNVIVKQTSCITNAIALLNTPPQFYYNYNAGNELSFTILAQKTTHSHITDYGKWSKQNQVIITGQHIINRKKYVIMLGDPNSVELGH